MRITTGHSRSQRSGMVLIAVLVMIVLLSLAAYQFSELMVQEYGAAQSALRSAQAKALADSGVYYTAAMLSDPDTFKGTLSSNPFDNATAFHGIEVGTSRNRTGRFSIVAPQPPDDASTSSGFRYGVIDESSKININAVVKLSPDTAYDMLMKLPNMTEEAADSIIDWIDADEDPRTNGAENTTYGGMTPPYRCKNGPLDSIEELLLVRGVTPQLLFGSDRNRNGIQDPGEDDGSGWNPGWAAYLTIYSREKNVDAEGTARIYLNDSKISTFYDPLKEAVGQTLADFIVLYRTQSTTAPMGNMPVNAASEEQIADAVKAATESTSAPARSVSSKFALVSATVYLTVGQGNMRRTVRLQSPLADQGQLRELLPKLLDKTTTQKDAEVAARVNVLTAPREVLTCLPGMTEAEVQSLVQARPAQGGAELTDPVYQTTAWMLLDANMTAARLSTLDRYITSRTQVYRVQSLGFSDQGGPVARVEAIVDTNNGKPRILMWRDLSELGRGYNVTGTSP